MELTPIFRSVVALDGHQSKLTVCALFEDEPGDVQVQLKEFGGFKRDRQAMAQWVASFEPEVVVMESTGIYWKSPYAALERVGIQALVVNAYHVKQVPGRKTDIADAQWLAILARSGLLKGGFVPPSNFRHLRLLLRQLQKLTGILAGEKNRLHKVLTDGGIRLLAVLGDLHGKSARQMVKGLLAGESPQQVLVYASNRLRATEEELLDALDGELSETHRFVLSQILEHIEYLAARIGCFQQQLLRGLQPQAGILQALFRRSPASMRWGPPGCWWRSAMTCRPLAAPRSSPLGPVCVRTTTRQPARGRRGSDAKAIPTYGASCARRPAPPAELAAHWPKNSKPCSFAVRANGPSSRWLTRY
jgi:transposase